MVMNINKPTVRQLEHVLWSTGKSQCAYTFKSIRGENLVYNDFSFIFIMIHTEYLSNKIALFSNQFIRFHCFQLRTVLNYTSYLTYQVLMGKQHQTRRTVYLFLCFISCSGAFTVKTVGGDATLFSPNARRAWEIIKYYEWLQIHDADNSKQCVITDSIQV